MVARLAEVEGQACGPLRLRITGECSGGGQPPVGLHQKHTGVLLTSYCVHCASLQLRSEPNRSGLVPLRACPLCAAVPQGHRSAAPWWRLLCRTLSSSQPPNVCPRASPFRALARRRPCSAGRPRAEQAAASCQRDYGLHLWLPPGERLHFERKLVVCVLSARQLPARQACIMPCCLECMASASAR